MLRYFLLDDAAGDGEDPQPSTKRKGASNKPIGRHVGQKRQRGA